MPNPINNYNFNNLSVGNKVSLRAKPPASNGDKPTDVLPADQVSISREARRLQAHGLTSDRSKSNDAQLSKEEKQMVNALKKRDVEVKIHEAAHMAAGGTVVQGGASYQYQSGPDGKMYAVGGEVKIDLSSEGTPEATIRKMQEVRRAAMAPAQPSGTDRAVAAQATQIEAQARMEKNKQDKDETHSDHFSASNENQTVHPSSTDVTQPLTSRHIDLKI